jgi:formiminotetrahydrofolate cyclodeaminase
MLELRLDEFLEEIAGDRLTPGGGSLAAVVTAASAGLLAKVARASKEDWADAAGAAAQAESLRARAEPLAQVSADQYESAVVSLATVGAEAPERRDFAVGRAHARAAEPPMRIVETATDVAELAVAVAKNGEPSLRADVATAAVLAAAAARAAAELVAVNLTAGAADERVARARKLAGLAARAADEAFAGGRAWE